MNVPVSFLPSHQAPAAAGLAYAVATWDECVSLVGEDADTAVVLDQAERELSRKGVRCIRVCGLPSTGLSLRGLMAQVAGRADVDALTDDDLAAGFKALTEPGDGYDRVALLVTKAHGLLPSAVRYIQFACRSSPKLLVVLSGQSNLTATLADEEFAYLRRRITRRLELRDPAAHEPMQPFSTAVEPSPEPAPRETAPVAIARRLGGSGTLVRLGLAASLALVVWTTRWGGTHPPPVTATSPETLAGRRDAAAVRTEPQAPLIGVYPASLEASKPVAPPVDQRPAEARPSTVAEPQRPVEPEPERVQAEVRQGFAAFPPLAEPDPAPPVEAVDVPALQAPATPRELAEASGATPSEPPAEATPEHQAEPAQRAEPAVPLPPDRAVAVADPPLGDAAASTHQDAASGPPAGMQDQPAEPVQRAGQGAAQPPGQAVAVVADPPPAEAATSVEQATAQPVTAAERVPAPAPEPPAAQAALPPGPAADASLPLPPSPPAFRQQAAATVPPAAAAERARRARRAVEANPAPVEPAPTQSVVGTRCRDILLKAQLGEDPSDADKQFMRGGCRAR